MVVEAVPTAQREQWALSMLPAVTASELLRLSIRVKVTTAVGDTEVLRSHTDGSGLEVGDPTVVAGPSCGVNLVDNCPRELQAVGTQASKCLDYIPALDRSFSDGLLVVTARGNDH